MVHDEYVADYRSAVIAELARAGLVSRTFLRLDPAKRDGVIDAVCLELAETGPAALAIKAVAVRAGIPVGSLYQYFGDRDTMVTAICTIVAKALVTELESYIPVMRDLPLREGLESYIKYSLEWAQRQPVMLKVFGVAIYREAVLESLAAATTVPAAGEKIGSVDPRQNLQILVAPVARTVLWLTQALLEGARDRVEIDGTNLGAKVRLVNALIITLCDARLFPGLDRYYQFSDGTVELDQMIKSAVDFIVKALAGGSK